MGGASEVDGLEPNDSHRRSVTSCAQLARRKSPGPSFGRMWESDQQQASPRQQRRVLRRKQRGRTGVDERRPTRTCRRIRQRDAGDACRNQCGCQPQRGRRAGDVLDVGRRDADHAVATLAVGSIAARHPVFILPGLIRRGRWAARIGMSHFDRLHIARPLRLCECARAPRR